MKHFIIILVCFLISEVDVFGQSEVVNPEQNEMLMTRELKNGNEKVFDSIKIYRNGVCKSNYFFVIRNSFNSNAIAIVETKVIPNKKVAEITGNVSYEYLYRSYLDTPFTQNDFSQHSIVSNLKLTSREGVPINLNFRVRFSNSPFFKDNIDFGTAYTKDMLVSNIKHNLKGDIPKILLDSGVVNLEKTYKEKIRELSFINSKLKDNSTMQKMVEAKEKESKRKLREKSENIKPQIPDSALAFNDSIFIINDSLLQNADIEKLKIEKQELEKEIKILSVKVNQAKKDLNEKRQLLTSEINKIKDLSSLESISKKYNLPDSSLPKHYKLLMSINKLGLGRNWVNYSELTVKNTLISGVNLETNFKPLLLSVTGGTINYGFRDFMVNTNRVPNQRLFAIRVGLGTTEGNRVLLTYYNGNKALLNSYNNPVQEVESVSGLSLEGSFKIHSSTSVTLEIAKSTLPDYLNSVYGQGKMMDFKLRSNEAYSIKLESDYFKNTRIKGFYKKAGDQFQSFNMMPVSVQQEAWALNVSRSFMKKKIFAEAGIKKNDFANNLTNIGLTSSTVFKTFTMSLRVPKYPYVTLGYYPSTQLTVLDDQRIAESYYNTFNVVSGYVYRFGKCALTSNIAFVKFSNDASDTNFVYSNARSLTFNQSLLFNKTNFQVGYSKITQPDFSMQTIEGKFSYMVNNWFSANGGLKRVTNQEIKTLYGKNIGVQLSIKKLGSVNLQYEQNYLLGRNQKLLPVDFGKLIYTKTFK